jgi:hypothetical protein
LSYNEEVDLIFCKVNLKMGKKFVREESADCEKTPHGQTDCVNLRQWIGGFI